MFHVTIINKKLPVNNVVRSSKWKKIDKSHKLAPSKHIVIITNMKYSAFLERRFPNIFRAYLSIASKIFPMENKTRMSPAQYTSFSNFTNSKLTFTPPLPLKSVYVTKPYMHANKNFAPLFYQKNDNFREIITKKERSSHSFPIRFCNWLYSSFVFTFRNTSSASSIVTY